jgi:hypothetical protein
VAEYRAYVLGKAGQILNRHAFESPDDAAALEHARKFLGSSDVEVWQLDRLVGTLKHSQ